MGTGLDMEMSRKTSVFGLRVWVLMGVTVGMFIIFILLVLSLCLTIRKKSRKASELLPFNRIPAVSMEIKDIQVDHISPNKLGSPDRGLLNHDALSGRDPQKMFAQVNNGVNNGPPNMFNNVFKDESHQIGKEKSNMARSPVTAFSPVSGLPEFSQLGWGHWFTLRDLQLATNFFAKESIVGEGGYGIVYRGHLINGSPVAVKKLLNNQGQAEREFRVEVEAIGHVRHKNLVRLLGYCIEGTQRLLVYEYVSNGNLEQWLHGAMQQHGYLTWEARMKILLGTAKALEYLHEGIEPKVVHRDIKSSNILIDEDFNAKLSDFGLAKLLGAGKSHISTRVMGTFGYVAPEYASSGLLNEKSDVYSFGILILEVITGRDPVDYGRPQHEVNMIDWLKMMVGSRRSEEVVDPNIKTRPSTSALKRALLTALRCVDLNVEKRPKMGQVVHMLESEEYPLPREDRRQRRSQADVKAETEEENPNKAETAGH